MIAELFGEKEETHPFGAAGSAEVRSREREAGVRIDGRRGLREPSESVERLNLDPSINSAQTFEQRRQPLGFLRIEALGGVFSDERFETIEQLSRIAFDQQKRAMFRPQEIFFDGVIEKLDEIVIVVGGIQ